MISIATPHIAEDWWKMMVMTTSWLAEVFELPDQLTSAEKDALDAETYLRAFLEQARKVAKVATKHIGNAPNSATIHISRPWKKHVSLSLLLTI